MKLPSNKVKELVQPGLYPDFQAWILIGWLVTIKNQDILND